MSPAANAFGTTQVTVNVTDGALSAQRVFTLTVDGVNDLPTISNITDQTTDEDTAKNNVAFTISDVESSISCTSTTGIVFTSSNTAILPVVNITRG